MLHENLQKVVFLRFFMLLFLYYYYLCALIEELTAQRKLTEKAQKQIYRLLTIIKNVALTRRSVRKESCGEKD